MGGVAAIEASQAAAAGWSLRQFEAELEVESSVFLVAEEAGRLLGFAVARRHPPRLELLDIAVSSTRRGVGRALLEGLRAQAAGCARLTLEVSERNASALAFYRACGFRVVGRRPKFYNDGAGAVLMDLFR
ncbi:MAG: GNAT family N-acetyltransferase [Elusimicrobia bacterium]|nr:GNAT family N-acetyltransferase [Elusimicrobiota bacterium]